MNKKKNNSINFSELVIGNEIFRESLMSQYELEELHIQLEGNGKKLTNVDYAILPIEMKRHIDYTTITIIEIKINDEKQRDMETLLRFCALRKYVNVKKIVCLVLIL